MRQTEVIVPRPAGHDRAPRGTTAVVVGGGIAGLAASCVLAERGVRVTLFEREPFLGGRAGSWPDTLIDGTPFQMERGFHAFFRQYYNLRNLLKRVDPCLDALRPTADYPLIGPGGRTESFAGLPKRPPLNVLALLWRSSAISLADLSHLQIPMAREMLAYDPHETYARWEPHSAKAYLDALGFPEDARRMLFDVFAHSFFNPEDQFSAAELLSMFHFYFLANPEGLIFDVARRPFGPALWEPLGRYLTERGARVLTRTAVEKIEARSSGWAVRVAQETDAFGADLVVLAVTVPALKKLVAASARDLPDEAWRRRIETLGVTSRFAVWRMWLDRPVQPTRAPFAGTTGLGILDNVSVYEKIEDESAAWAARHGGSIVELHAYSVPPDMTDGAIRADMRRALHAVYPETRPARVLEERFIIRQDCPAFPPGGHATRPEVETPFTGLALAGDFTKLSFPTALMERAASSGFSAANGLLAPYGVRSEPLFSVPTHGWLARTRGFRAGAPRSLARRPGTLLSAK